MGKLFNIGVGFLFECSLCLILLMVLSAGTSFLCGVSMIKGGTNTTIKVIVTGYGFKLIASLVANFS